MHLDATVYFKDIDITELSDLRIYQWY